MATVTLSGCSAQDSLALERVKYFPRQLLTADDMTADQDYFRNKMRRHNRYLHGWGVVCGIEVTVAPVAKAPWRIQIGAGYALGPYGDEIHIPEPVLLDLAQCGAGGETDPCDPGSLLRGFPAKSGAKLFVAVRYEECYTRPVRVAPGGCGCQETSCEPSRVRETFQIECLAELPASHQPASHGASLCDLVSGRALAPCPPCPADPWVVLAQVALPDSSQIALKQQQIDQFVRRQLFSTAVIQEQVIQCCCTGQQRRPARVTSINPAQDTVFDNSKIVPRAVLVTFSKSLQPATVDESTVQVLRLVPRGLSVRIKGSVEYDDGLRQAKFTPEEALKTPGTYQVTVVGSGKAPILDIDDMALDGNDDGQAGGNFQSQFGVVSTTVVSPERPTGIGSLVAADVDVISRAAVIERSQSAGVADVSLTLTGGTPGQTSAETVQVVLNADVAGGNDTAILTDPEGRTYAGTKGRNSYTFAGVPVAPSETGEPRTYKITNMKVNTASTEVVPGSIVAAVSFAPGSAIQLRTPTGIVGSVVR
jgi:hypothetical protein